MEAKTGVMYLQAKGHQGLLAAPRLGETHGRDSPSETPEGANPLNALILDIWLPEL